MPTVYNELFSFHEELRIYYQKNKKKVRSRYNDLTKKFLAYNDVDDNPSAYLRRPQFEALEMYIFIKEFMGNPQVYEMFDDWRNRKNEFADNSYYSVNKVDQFTLWDDSIATQTQSLFDQMKMYREAYPNYIYALTMGLGKTILMATCIFYEFLLANKYPKDKRYCHNALVFAPDKTVLQSLREIITFDKTLVVPPEYSKVLDANIKFHFLMDDGSSLHTIDGSNFNIIISNTQKIIVKKKRKEDKPADILFSSLLSKVYGEGDIDDEIKNESALIENQRFEKLRRLTQLGVYVDEAHHLFGSDLEKEIRSKNGRKTSLRDTINMLADSTSIIACYNYTGTPYVNKQLLPEVVYAYGLKESIQKGYLKDADLKAFENVKNEDFLREVIDTFWKKYGDGNYEGLLPKLAIFAATIEEAINDVRPVVEEILSSKGIPASKILVNVGDEKFTKDEDIKNFNDLDVQGSVGNQKQFLILVGKGREGWNCRSLFGVALFRSPKSKIFVLQATMRCLRKITDQRQTATVFLSKENYDVLDAELEKNFNMEIKDMSKQDTEKTQRFHVKVVPPPRTVSLKKIWREYSLNEKEYREPINFDLDNLETSRYESRMYERDSFARQSSEYVTILETSKNKIKFSILTLTAEISRYLNISPIFVSRILKESLDGDEKILEIVNKYNEVLYDRIVPVIFNALYDIKGIEKTEDREIILLKEPKEGGYYEFSANPELVVRLSDSDLREEEREKSFHADTYCFDSKPELECFRQYIRSDKVKKIYFTGMFTSNQGELSIQYYDPESRRIRQYYPDFFAVMEDGSFQIIEVKGDNKIDDLIVKAKAEAASTIAAHSGIEYRMYRGSELMSKRILEDSKFKYQIDMDE